MVRKVFKMYDTVVGTSSPMENILFQKRCDTD